MGHIVSTEVISEPGAAMRVEVLHLGEEARANLTTNATGLDRKKGEMSKGTMVLLLAGTWAFVVACWTLLAVLFGYPWDMGAATGLGLTAFVLTIHSIAYHLTNR